MTSYTYLKRTMELEDSDLLQSYNVNSSVKKNLEKLYIQHKSLDYLDMWANDGFNMLDRNRDFFYILFESKIQNMLRSFLLIYEKKHLRSSTDASKAVESYFRLCRMSGMNEGIFQYHMFRTAAHILFEANVESPPLFGKLFELMCCDKDILDHVMNNMRLDQLNVFLKQLRLGGYSLRKSFPLSALYVDVSSDRILIFLQHINSFGSDYRNVAYYIRELYEKRLKDVIPENNSVERFDMLQFTFAHSGFLDDASLILSKKLVWRSVPHAYPTITEVNEMFKKLTSDNAYHEYIQQTIKNYHQILIFPTSMPRSLKHYARTAFRKFYLIPEAIDNAIVPQSLTSYLKLHK